MWGVHEWLPCTHCQGSIRAGLLVSLEKSSVALIMNSIIEYIAFVPFFYRKVTFCNHVMYIKLFIKVNILHNKQFLNKKKKKFRFNLVTSSVRHVCPG